MMALVAPRSTSRVNGLPSNSVRSTGGPASMCTVCRGHRCGLVVPYGRMSCAPQVATGTTGTPLARASRATPVLATIGHCSGSRVAVPSG